MDELPLPSLLRNGIFPYERTKKRIRCKIRQPISLEATQVLEYWKRIQPIPIECEAVDANTFQHLVQKLHAQSSPDESTLLETKLSQILETAYHQDCSDIHFEPHPNVIQIFIRQQGKRSLLTQWPKEWQSSFLRNLKIKAGLDIQPTTLPLNGQFSYRLPKETIFCRLSIFPSLHGDCVVLRIHSPKTNQQRSMDPLLQTRFAQSIFAAKPGLWMITGPIGNGKTTTYYYLLNCLQSKYRVFSFEDPIEIKQPQLLQFKGSLIHPLEKAMHMLLRQSISVVGFGEVRASDQLKFVVNAALTGHCVLTTFHANSIESALLRLQNFGYTQEQQLLFLNGILYQHFERTAEGIRQLVYRERIFLPDLMPT